MTYPAKPSIFHKPTTRTGVWAVGLAIANILMSILNTTLFMRLGANRPADVGWLIAFGFTMLAVGLASGVVGLISIIRNHERSWLVWLTLLPGSQTVVFILGEFLFSH